MCHIDSSCKCSNGIFVEHVLVEFCAGAVGHLMTDERVVIYMLFLVGNHTAIASTFCTFASKGEIKAVACHTIVKGYHIVVDTAISLLLDIDIADTYVLVVCLFQTIEVERGIVANKCFDDLCGKEIAVIGCMVAE